ncbi:uncharacterized protein LOC121247253 [Juglans microcarpa x Juglans regia]|uniref:uncharacterized protein LOC121247253 n=1 Tax=Juglans microcarpa x Juglans regia TaxID=2249226 RepID=UPI001B7EB8AF|nr:uncharacterized protein LOC121247253 [Juglans microcarpa x Juglans regia]
MSLCFESTWYESTFGLRLMMDVDIESLYANLLLSEKECEDAAVDVHQVENVLARGEHCLLIKLLTRKHYNHEAFKQTMRKIWRPVRSMKYCDLSPVFTLVEFEDPRDKMKVLKEGPWSFNKQLVLVKEYDGMIQIDSLNIIHASFWIRIHDLPLMAYNMYIGKLIGGLLGEFLEVDLDEGEMEWGEYMRVRVRLDISQPLQRRKRLNLGGGKSCWVRLSYEHLPDFCFTCGILGHTQREFDCYCLENVSSSSPTYASWLLAGSSVNRKGVKSGQQVHTGMRGVTEPPVPTTERESQLHEKARSLKNVDDAVNRADSETCLVATKFAVSDIGSGGSVSKLLPDGEREVSINLGDEQSSKRGDLLVENVTELVEEVENGLLTDVPIAKEMGPMVGLKDDDPTRFDLLLSTQAVDYLY